jgi:hypothetical protein
MKKVFSCGAACFFLIIAFAGAQSEITGERLLAAIPSGYELGYHQKTDQNEISEFIPKGETLEAWSEMITVQLFPAHNTSAKFYATFESLIKQACADGSSHVVATTEENGYPVKVFQLFCPTNPQTDMGEITFIKTIEGKDKFYVVQKAWRTEKYKQDQLPLKNEDIVKWTQYLRSVNVCDSRSDQRACPQ